MSDDLRPRRVLSVFAETNTESRLSLRVRHPEGEDHRGNGSFRTRRLEDAQTKLASVGDTVRGYGRFRERKRANRTRLRERCQRRDDEKG